MKRLTAIVVRQRRYLGLAYRDAARSVGMSEGHWSDMESGRRNPTVPTLDKMAGAVGLELELVAGHHRPFLELDPAEAWELMRIAQHYRRNVRQPADVLVTLTNKLDRWMRARRPVGRPRKVDAA